MNQLKPCPFCGGNAEMDTRQSYAQFPPNGRTGTRIVVYCCDCGADIGVCREDVPDVSAEEVAESWNRRSVPDDLPVLTLRLVRSLRQAAPGNELPDKALDYLRRHGLLGSPLRATESE